MKREGFTRRLQKRITRGTTIKAPCFCRGISLALSLALVFSLLPGSFPHLPFSAGEAWAAGGRSLLLSQAQSMALSHSPDCKKKYNEILLKRIRYQDAVRSAYEKMRNITTFRWSPLIKLHFPQSPDMIESLEFHFKPMRIQIEIMTLEHELADMKYEILEKVNEAYSDCFIGQEKIRFGEEIIGTAKEELAKNRYRLIMGKASQSDIDVMEKFIKTKESDLALLKRTFQVDKERLTELVGMDVTTGYGFKNPYKTAEIPRRDLEKIVQHTLSLDQEYYAAGLTASLDKSNLDMCYSLMASRYGGKLGWISSYVTMASQGKEVDTAAFQMAYDSMLRDIDSPWQGYIRILFIKIYKEWFKGALDGVRYVEDEPYALFNACLDYVSSYKEKQDVEKSVRSQVSADYETLVTSKNAYHALEERVAELSADLERVKILNKQGDAEYQEVKDKQTDYQDAQMDLLDALKDYNDLLYAYDRLTCGAVSAYFKDQGVSFSGGGTADSSISVEDEDIPYYYIESRVQDMKFALGIHVPDGFEPDITDFELWYGNMRIGERTPANRELSHLAVAADNAESRFTIRLYDSGRFIKQCEINPTVDRDRLDLEEAVVNEKQTERVVGTYQVSMQPEIGLTTLSLTLLPGVNARYFEVLDQNGKAIYRDEPVAVAESFTYLSLLAGDLGKVTVRLYDSEEHVAYNCRLDVKKQQLVAQDGT